MRHGGRPGFTKICGMSITVQLTTCQEQTTLLKDFTSFEPILEMPNPDIWKLYEAIQKQQSQQGFTLSQLQLGKKVHARKKNNFGRMKRIVCSAANYKEINYLKAIAVNFSFYFSSIFGLVMFMLLL